MTFLYVMNCTLQLLYPLFQVSLLIKCCLLGNLVKKQKQNKVLSMSLHCVSQMFTQIQFFQTFSLSLRLSRSVVILRKSVKATSLSVSTLRRMACAVVDLGDLQLFIISRRSRAISSCAYYLNTQIDSCWTSFRTDINIAIYIQPIKTQTYYQQAGSGIMV